MTPKHATKNRETAKIGQKGTVSVVSMRRALLLAERSSTVVPDDDEQLHNELLD